MSSVIKNYSFSEISTGDQSQETENKFKGFSLEEIDNIKSKINPRILEFERKNSEERGFRIDENVEKHRGLLENKLAEQRKKISDIVEREIKIIKKETVETAFQEGVEKANKEVWDKESDLINKRLEKFDEMITNFESYFLEVNKLQEENFLNIIRSVTKWVTRKENLETGYLKNLVAKTIDSDQCREKAIVNYNPKMNETFSKEIEKLKNHYVESPTVSFVETESIGDSEIEIETTNKFLKLGLDSQFQLIDEIFNSFQEENSV
jgi:flagellar biosynthesis/type III secretory pathway protein FliH